jgi:predicted lipid carrier protein YhbT
MWKIILLNISSFESTINRIPAPINEKLINIIPKVLKPVLAAVPLSIQRNVLLSSLTSVFQEAIEDGDFEFLQNKWLKISVTDLNLCWLISVKENQLIMADKQKELSSDVSFSATSDDLLLIAGRKEDPDTLFFQRRLKIEGDTELGLEVKNLIDAVEFEKLPSVVHKVVQVLATFIQSVKT